MLPVFDMGRRDSDPAMLASDAEKLLTAFSFNGRMQYREAEVKPTSNGQPPTLSEREKWLASVLCKTPSPNHSPASSISSSSDSLPPSLSLSFSSISSSASFSSFFSPLFTNQFLAVRPSSKRGLGIFAIQDIPVNTTILTEKPLIKVYALEEVPWRYHELSREKKRAFDSLHHWVGIERDRIFGIYKTNRFELSGSGSGLFYNCSRFNHACHPHSTCTYSWIVGEGHMKVSTLRDVTVGEELTISYMGYSVNQKLLMANYDFECDCPSCTEKKRMEEEAKEQAAVAQPLRSRHRF